jgi:hypothetical protein
MNDTELRIRSMELAVSFQGHIVDKDELMQVANKIYHFIVADYDRDAATDDRPVMISDFRRAINNS